MNKPTSAVNAPCFNLRCRFTIHLTFTPARGVTPHKQGTNPTENTAKYFQLIIISVNCEDPFGNQLKHESDEQNLDGCNFVAYFCQTGSGTFA